VIEITVFLVCSVNREDGLSEWSNQFGRAGIRALKMMPDALGTRSMSVGVRQLLQEIKPGSRFAESFPMAKLDSAASLEAGIGGHVVTRHDT